MKDFCDCTQMVTEIENHLIVDRLFYVKVHGMDADEYSTYASVTFYDTSKEEDVNVNQVLLDKILQEMAVAFKIHVIYYPSIYYYDYLFIQYCNSFTFLHTLVVFCRRDN